MLLLLWWYHAILTNIGGARISVSLMYLLTKRSKHHPRVCDLCDLWIFYFVVVAVFRSPRDDYGIYRYIRITHSLNNSPALQLKRLLSTVVATARFASNSLKIDGGILLFEVRARPKGKNKFMHWLAHLLRSTATLEDLDVSMYDTGLKQGTHGMLRRWFAFQPVAHETVPTILQL